MSLSPSIINGYGIDIGKYKNADNISYIDYV